MTFKTIAMYILVVREITPTAIRKVPIIAPTPMKVENIVMPCTMFFL